MLIKDALIVLFSTCFAVTLSVLLGLRRRGTFIEYISTHSHKPCKEKITILYTDGAMSDIIRDTAHLTFKMIVWHFDHRREGLWHWLRSQLSVDSRKMTTNDLETSLAKLKAQKIHYIKGTHAVVVGPWREDEIDELLAL